MVVLASRTLPAEVPAPVAGPIALGHSCHFGLGLFVAAEGLERR